MSSWSKEANVSSDGNWGTNSSSGNSRRNTKDNNHDIWSGTGSSALGRANRGGGGGGWGEASSSSHKVNESTDDGGWGCASSGKNKANESIGGGGWGEARSSNNKANESIDDGGWGCASSSNNKANESPGHGGFSNSGSNVGGWSNSTWRKDNNDRSDEGGGEERPAPYKPSEEALEEERKLQFDEVGENFAQLRDQKVLCMPPGSIKPINSFKEAITSKHLLKIIEFQRYTSMTPIQQWAIPAILRGHDLIGCAQTGSGKTAAFLLPVLQTLIQMPLEPNQDECQNPYCLVISPTRELARQIYTHAQALSKDSIIKCCVIYGAIQTGHLKASLSRGCHILVATPGRLKDFVERGWIGFSNIKYIILDEGDRLVDEGFTSDIRGFFSHPTMPPKNARQTLFFSATFQKEIQLAAKEYLKEGFVFLTVGRIGAANTNIKQEFMVVDRANKKRELKQILMAQPDEDKTIIFTQTKVAADMLASFFTALKLSATSIHGDRHQSQREQAIQEFKKGTRRYLISSPVGNRGLDLPKVALVINYDLPKNIDEYVHRIGRTGRAGHIGKAISFYDESRDSELLQDLIGVLKEAKQDVPDWMINGVASIQDTGQSGFTTTSNQEVPASSNNNWDEDWTASTIKDNDQSFNKAVDNASDWGQDWCSVQKSENKSANEDETSIIASTSASNSNSGKRPHSDNDPWVSKKIDTGATKNYNWNSDKKSTSDLSSKYKKTNTAKQSKDEPEDLASLDWS